MLPNGLAFAGGGSSRRPWAKVRRAPLGPFPQPVTYPTTLSFVPPADRDLYFVRGNFCGLRMPNAPVVPGSNANNPACVMSCLLDNYPPAIQDEYLDLYAGSYTHLQRSLGHALYYGSSISQFNALTKRAQRLGLFADVWMIANEFPGFEFNRDWSFWGPKLLPLIKVILDAGAIDSACPAWQLDQIMMQAPGNATLSIIAGVADALPPSVPVYSHWVNEALAWWKTGGEVWVDHFNPNGVNVENRFDFWRVCAPYLTGGYYQGDGGVAMTNPKLYQDRMRDTLDPFAGDVTKGNIGRSIRRGYEEDFRLMAFEATAQNQFDNRCTELQGDGAGYLQMCTHGYNNSHLAGGGNGMRMPDGNVV